jgi:hypothetical protein
VDREGVSLSRIVPLFEKRRWRDIETSYEGLRLYEVSSTLVRSPLAMYWNDTLVQAAAVDMPCAVSQGGPGCPNGDKGLETSGPNGVDPGSYASAASPNVNARSWDDFTGNGKGNNSFLDTFTWIQGSASTSINTNVVDSTVDTDGDGQQVGELTASGREKTDRRRKGNVAFAVQR